MNEEREDGDEGRLSVVELREPRNLCVCVSEECGHGEGVGAHPTLLTDTRRRVVSLTENTGRIPGVEFREPRNLCVCVRKECGHGEGADAHATLLTVGNTSDSGMGLSITIDKFRVFINKTLSILSAYQ